MEDTLKKEILRIIKCYYLECSVEEFCTSFVGMDDGEDVIDWEYIFEHQQLSEDFIKTFKDKVSYTCICRTQVLSIDLINSLKEGMDEDLLRSLEDKFKASTKI